MYERYCFKFKEFTPSAISSSGNIFGIKLGIADFLFAFYLLSHFNWS